MLIEIQASCRSAATRMYIYDCTVFSFGQPSPNTEMKSTLFALAILLGVLASLVPTHATTASEQRQLN